MGEHCSGDTCLPDLRCDDVVVAGGRCSHECIRARSPRTGTVGASCESVDCLDQYRCETTANGRICVEYPSLGDPCTEIVGCDAYFPPRAICDPETSTCTLPGRSGLVLVFLGLRRRAGLCTRCWRFFGHLSGSKAGGRGMCRATGRRLRWHGVLNLSDRACSARSCGGAGCDEFPRHAPPLKRCLDVRATMRRRNRARSLRAPLRARL